MALAAQGQSEKLRLGKVVGNTISFIGRNLLFSLVVGALFFVLPAMLATLGVAFWYWSRLSFSGCGGQWVPEAFMLVSALLATALNFVGYAVLSRATIDGIKGDRPSVGGSIQAALRHALPIVGIGFAIYLAVFLASYAMLRAGLLTPSEALAAFFVLLAPLIPWALGISVAVPVAIQEGLGVRASTLRSRALTKGHRWPIFGLFSIVIGLFIVRQVGLALAFVFVSTALAPVSAFIAGALLDVLAWAMIWMVASITIAVTYMELRRIKEGASVGDLAEIFS